MAGKKARKIAKAEDKAERKRAKKEAKAARLGAGALLPKRLAGIEVPPVLRQSGSALAEFATSELGRAVLVAALTGAAEAILRHRPAGESAAPVTAKDVVQGAALAAAGVVKDAARTVLPPALMGEAGKGEAGKGETGRGEAGRADGARPAEERRGAAKA